MTSPRSVTLRPFLALSLAVLLAFGPASAFAANPQENPNDAVRRKLLVLGDDGTAPRETIHYAYPKGAGVRPYAQLLAVAEIMGFETFPAAVDGGMILVETAPVAGPDFDTRTQALEVLFSTGGWDCAGWECAVVTSEPAPE